MYIHISNWSINDAGDIVTTCPMCGMGGTFDKLQNVTDIQVVYGGSITHRLGQRKCPNRACNAHIFFVRDTKDGSLTTYPSLRIDFKTDNIPEGIRNSFDEAITCHAEGCFIASAIMVRRTLEEICNEKNAEGKNLKARINALQENVVLPKGLIGAMNELRLLGNDAAHIESKDYNNIGNDEITAAIEVTKEILKGVYQMDSLIDRLRDLKKPPRE